MKVSGATVWWYEKDGALRYGAFTASQLYSDRTYQSEAINVVPDDIEEWIVSLNNAPNYEEQLECFKSKYQSMHKKPG
jgi:hypothetical protein